MISLASGSAPTVKRAYYVQGARDTRSDFESENHTDLRPGSATYYLATKGELSKSVSSSSELRDNNSKRFPGVLRELKEAKHSGAWDGSWHT